MRTTRPTSPAVLLIAPPYEVFQKVPSHPLRDALETPGAALVWWLMDAETQLEEFRMLRARPAGMPLIVVLPPPDAIAQALPLLRSLRELRPRAVLPAGTLDTPRRIRELLTTPQGPLGESICNYIIERGVIDDPGMQRCIRRIVELAPEVKSISQLSRRLYMSRRTLGRHFSVHNLPVPSHWLQFARLMHVAVHIQQERTAIFRIGVRMGYNDGFSLSNQMKRLLGVRPTDVRRCLGWEWLVESWLRREGLVGLE